MDDLVTEVVFIDKYSSKNITYVLEKGFLLLRDIGTLELTLLEKINNKI